MRIILFLLSITIYFSCQSPSAKPSQQLTGKKPFPESPDIHIQVKGLEQGLAYLIGFNEAQQYRVDSAQVDQKGRIHFQRMEAYPPGLYFAYLPDRTALQLLIDVDQRFEITTQKGELVNALTVKGSVENTLLYKNLVYEAGYQPRVQEVNGRLKQLAMGSFDYVQVKNEQERLIEERKAHLRDIFAMHPEALFTQFKMAGQNPDVRDVRLPNGTVDKLKQLVLYRNEFWENVDFSDERLLRTPVIINKLKRYITELTPQDPDSIKAATDYLVEKVIDHPSYYRFFVNWIAVNYEPTKTTLMDGEAVYVHMVQKYITHSRAFWADSFEVVALQNRAQEMGGSLVGMKGQDVQAPDLNGKPRSIYELTNDYVIVYLFNPTCDHCMEETPKLVKLLRDRMDLNLGVYTIVVNSEKKEWENFLRDYQMEDFVNVADFSYRSIYGKYYVDNTPEIYILAPDRQIIAKNLKVHQVAETIERHRSGN